MGIQASDTGVQVSDRRVAKILERQCIMDKDTLSKNRRDRFRVKRKRRGGWENGRGKERWEEIVKRFL